MLNILWTILAILLCLWIVCRLVAWVIIWFCKWVLKVDVKIGKVGFFTYGDVHLNLNLSTTIDIERVWFSSSFINSDTKKPFAVCTGDVRVEIKNEKNNHERKEGRKKSPRKLRTIMSLLQNVCFSGDNIHIFVVETSKPDALIHVTIQEILASFTCGFNSFQLELKLDSFNGKFLKRPQQGQEGNVEMAEVSWSLQSDVLLDLTNLPKPEGLTINIEKPRILITEGLILHLQNLTTREENGVDIQHIDNQVPENFTDNHLLPKILPKKFQLKVDDTELKLSRETANNRSISMLVQTISLNLQCGLDLLPQMDLRFQVNGIDGRSEQANLIKVKSVNCISQVDDASINVKTDVDGGFLGYHHEDVQYWLAVINKLKNRQDQPLVENHDAELGRRNKLSNFLARRRLDMLLNVVDSRVAVAIAANNGLQGGVFEMKCNCRLEPCMGEDTTSLKSRNMSCKFEAASLYCKLVDGGAPTKDLSPRYHHWNTMAYCQNLKFEITKEERDLVVDYEMDCLQLEYSTEIYKLLKQLITAIKRTKHVGVQNQRARPANNLNLPGLQLNVIADVKCTGINLFVCHENKVCVIVRQDLIDLNWCNNELAAQLEGLKTEYQSQLVQVYPVLLSAEMQHHSAHINTINVVYFHHSKIMKMELTDQIQFEWSTSFHMCLHTAVQNALEIKDILSPPAQNELSLERPVRNNSSQPLNFSVKVKGNTHIALQLSQGHKLSFKFPDLNFTSRKGVTSVKMSHLSIACDQHDIFVLEGFCLGSLHHCDRLKHERAQCRGFVHPTNRAWGVNIDTFNIVFPYDYNFAGCYEHVINLNKWRKIVHKYVKPTFTPSSPLPPDILIKVQSVMIQICDDDFEVKLFDSHSLILDEHIETEKRYQALENRLRELNVSSVDDVNRAFDRLRKTMEAFYINRSKQAYLTCPMRTKLLTVVFENLEVIALADPSIHGKENVVKEMVDIDPQSPYPDGLEFTTLWCRHVNVSLNSWTIELRDFPQLLLDVKDFQVKGRLIGAEQVPQKRAIRESVVEVDEPWGDVIVERFMPSLKFFHDLMCECSVFDIAYGACWEPTIAMVNLMLNKINKPSIDPSHPMPFWDKARLLLHGHWKMQPQKMKLLYHVSLDPYNSTEMMDLTFSNLTFDWTNAKFLLQGDFDVYAKTASKYDDCRLLHLPNLELGIDLTWICLGNANDHHAVMPCAPDKTPEYSLEEHDSFRAFRSQHFDISLTFETKMSDIPEDAPSCLFYASTLRWIDKMKMCLARVSRPIKRGKYFNAIARKKPQLTRHVKDIKLKVDLHQFHVYYWLSFAKQNGIEMNGGSFHLNMAPHLELKPVEDGLIHRPQPDWSIQHFDWNLSDATIWLCSSKEVGKEGSMRRRVPVNRSYFLSVGKVTYERNETQTEYQENSPEDNATHKVRIYNLRGSWTANNRDVGFSLYDGYQRAQTVQKSLSSDALKAFKVDATQTPGKPGRSSSVLGSTPGPTPHNLPLEMMFDQGGSPAVAVHEEISGGDVVPEQLHGCVTCQTDDVIRKNFHVDLFNSQIKLKGCETEGYLIVSSEKASVLSYEHQPVWKDRQLKSKTTFHGSIEGMQYYATVQSSDLNTESEISPENINWLPKEAIEDKYPSAVGGISEMLENGQSVGGVVSGSREKDIGSSAMLQRIISKCRCQFFYASYGEVDDVLPEVVLPKRNTDPDLMKREEGVDCFTLLHHDLHICTNSLQYSIVLDIVNNLLLHVSLKTNLKNNNRMEIIFARQLEDDQDHKAIILEKQDNLRKLQTKMRNREKELYLKHKNLDEDPKNKEMEEEIDKLGKELEDDKEMLNRNSEELAILISFYKENQLIRNAQRKLSFECKASIVRINEVCFKHAEWRMTEIDGQIGIADLMLRNFLYTKTNKDDTSGSHHIELGFVKVTNLLPNSMYKEVLQPQDKEKRQMALRIMCEFKPPVNGIAIKEHFEINVIPMSLNLTNQFYRTVMAFFFPGKNYEEHDHEEKEPKSKKTAASTFHVQLEDKKSIDKMKERSAMNNMFSYIKIPSMPIKVSYKGKLYHIHDFNFMLPTLEYHSQTWTWLDFLMAVKKDSRRAVISQAIKFKLRIKAKNVDDFLRNEMQEEHEKAEIVLGPGLVDSKPPSKKSLFGKSSSSIKK